jgi:hypothetical protein
MAAYPYSPLEPTDNSIRLLHIQKGWSTEDIICQLFESYPDQERGVAYKALSYTWGGSMHTPVPGLPKVIVDGYEIEITKNLYSALLQIRRHDRDVPLWVDAICINQQDLREKGHQVKQMGDVYEGAEEVLIWLGPSNANIDGLLESINWIDARATEAQAVGSKEDWRTLCCRFTDQRPLGIGLDDQSILERTLEELLQRPWFTRVWVLQEVAKARTARILCGSSSCPARTFALMPAILGLDVHRHIQAVLGIMPRLRRHTWWSSTRHLHFLLQRFADSKALLVRDKIYALLGMSTDACNPEIFYPCYEKTDEEVFRDAASFFLFGEIIGPGYYSFPHFTIHDLRLPLALLAGYTLQWTLEQEGVPRHHQTSLRTAGLLIRYMNEGRLETASVLMYLFRAHSKVNLLRSLLLDKPEIRTEFWEQQRVVDFTSDREQFTVRIGPGKEVKLYY